ncbi:MAG: LuxR C-terminal-related transcriptional regulator [Rubrobacteraceae bacterium]
MARRRRAGVEEGAPKHEGASGGAPEAMRVWLLGGFRVSVGERAVEEGEWSLRKAKSLIKALSLAPGHQLHREQVMNLLWPNLSPESAANNLHRTLHAARRTLEPASRYLPLRGEQLALCPDGELRVDVEAFEEAAKAARRSRDPAAHRTAVDLYAGDLLPGDLYEDWVEGRREGLRSAHLELLVELAALHEEREEFEPAIEALRKVVDIEPAREEANVALMRLYALAGRRRAALEQYERFLKTLEGGAPTEAARRLRAEILAERFPPPREGAPPVAPSPDDTVPHNLPASLTSFVGREREMVEVKRSLAMNRLLTLTGAGGSGKTRLALEAAKDLAGLYPDGAWLVELAPLVEGALVPQEISRILKVREKPDRPTADALVDALRSKKLLLVLDNCEHLVDAVARLAETLLLSCPGLRVVATSREALGIAGEVRLPVPPLALPDPKRPAEEMERAESARLFVERASHRGSTFALTPRNAEAVARICRRLDGIPLAIELAAARVGAMSVVQISDRIEDSPALLTRGSRTATPRQRTLEGALDWGHELLAEPEKELFARLSTFAGGFSLEAAEAVGAGDDIGEGDVLDLLSALVDKSLVAAEADLETLHATSPRYRMLEPVRQYARGKLEASGNFDAVRRRHAAFFLALAEEAEPELRGAEQEAWLGRLDAEHENLRAALRWALEREAETGIRLAGALGEFWTMRGHLAEARGWLEAAIKDGGTQSPRVGKVLFWAGNMAREGGDYERAEELGEESLRLARNLGDEASAATILYDLGLLSLYQCAYEHSRVRLEEALALQRESEDSVGASLTLQALGLLATVQKDYAQASGLHEEALTLARETGDAIAAVFTLGSGALLAVALGDHEKAGRLRAEGMRLAMRFGYERLIIYYLHICAAQATGEGHLVRAAKLWGAAEALQEAVGSAPSPVETRHFEPYIRAVREGLEDPDSPWDEGRAMTKNEAADYALSEEERPEDEAGGGRAAAPLSPREREVAELVSEGFTNRRIAEKLFISKRTVDNHVRSILDKLGLDSREGVAARFPEDRA